MYVVNAKASRLHFVWTFYLLVLNWRLARSFWFPAFSQYEADDGSRREWHSHITESGAIGGNYFNHVMLVYGNEIQITNYRVTIGPNLQSLSVTILIGRQVINNNYLVQVRRKNETVKYACLQMFARSEHVIQLSQSTESDIEHPSLCHQNFTLDNWPYVNIVNTFSRQVECPLQGGFNVHVYDKTSKTGLCHAYQGYTRIEVACHEDAGMRFLFRDAECVPANISMTVNQHTFCMGSWIDGECEFVVLRHDKMSRFWCLRLSKQNDNQYVGLLFRDLFCDDTVLPETDAYLRLDISRDTLHVGGELCVDDFEYCRIAQQPCIDSASLLTQTCAKRCGLCSTTHPSTCSIPLNFHARWYDVSNRRRRVAADITEHVLNVVNQHPLQCVNWSNRSVAASPQFVELMFVAKADGGCKPRYSCVQLRATSPSVLRLKQSSTQMWPFPNSDARRIDCSGFGYAQQTGGSMALQDSHFKTLIAAAGLTYVDCELQRDWSFSVAWTTRHQRQPCRGSLTQAGLGTSSKKKLTLNGCDGEELEKIFACIASDMKSFSKEQLIITETLDTDDRFICWFFPSPPSDVFYQLPVSDCGEVGLTSRKLRLNTLNITATFTETLLTTSYSDVTRYTAMTSYTGSTRYTPFQIVYNAKPVTTKTVNSAGPTPDSNPFEHSTEEVRTPVIKQTHKESGSCDTASAGSTMTTWYEHAIGFVMSIVMHCWYVIYVL